MRTPLSRSGQRYGRTPTFTTRKPFSTAGVTCLASHPARQHLWAVGSYDAQVRLFDARNPARPIVDAGRTPQEIDVEGGVWRLKWHPTQADRLLVGGMHGGFKILDVPVGAAPAEASEAEQMSVVRRFDEHESIAYGCDWDRGSTHASEREARGETVVFSCSFYDARLHIWSDGDV